MSNSNWLRVTKSKPCKVCSKPDWCLVSADGRAAICARVESSNRRGDAGWFHWLEQPVPNGRVPQVQKTPTTTTDFGMLTRVFSESLNGHLAAHAAALGVSEESLTALGVGWDGEALTFPMFDSLRRPIGIRRRFADGRKLSIRGGREGVFRPSNIDSDIIHVCEGPTDTAALLTVGLVAIGRPSCSGGTKIVAELTYSLHVVIVADHDEVGMSGAKRLANAIGESASSVRIVTPPNGIKDARAWVAAGATRKDF